MLVKKDSSWTLLLFVFVFLLVKYLLFKYLGTQFSRYQYTCASIQLSLISLTICKKVTVADMCILYPFSLYNNDDACEKKKKERKFLPSMSRSLAHSLVYSWQNGKK